MGRQRQRSRREFQHDEFDNVVEIGTKSPKTFKRLTANHHRVIGAIRNNPITIINGPAGSLKTFLALQTGLALIDHGMFDKFLYIRQRIERPNEPQLGSLPGEKADKLSGWLNPIRDNLEAILNPYELAFYLDSGRIEASDIESIRGRSPLRTFLFCDEAQNCDLIALETVMTRRTECSRLVLAGDFTGQRDIFSKEFDAFELVCKEFKDIFAVINLNKNDILRSETNKDVIMGFEGIRSKLKSAN
jgi:predicted ribonuclease YlaK